MSALLEEQLMNTMLNLAITTVLYCIISEFSYQLFFYRLIGSAFENNYTLKSNSLYGG